MSLAKCPECQGQISTQATTCPHCGYPLLPPDQSKSKRGRPKKLEQQSLMRLPNGYGTIKALPGNRRQPFAAMVNPKLTLNEDTGKSYYTYDFLGSFSEKIDAYKAILSYQENPYDLKNDLTIKELYDAWLPKYIEDNKLDDNRRKAYDATFKYCEPVYNIKVVNFMPAMIEDQIKNAYKTGEKGTEAGKKIAATAIIKGNVKTLYNLLFDYAVFRRIVTENYARTFTTNLSKEVGLKSRVGRPYTKDELAILWSKCGDIFIDMTLVQCYSGWRPGEVITLSVNNIDLENRTYTGGIKTENGINRIVPIHSKVLPIIHKYYHEAINVGRPMLFGRTEKFHGSYRYIENSFRNSLLKKEAELGILGHVLHDGRHTFSTHAKEYGVDDYARKKFMGHSIKDLTDRVYTHMDIEWFRTEIERIL